MFVLPDVATMMSALEGDDKLSNLEKQKEKDKLNLLYAERSDRIHTINQLLRAHSLYEKDVDYVIQDKKIMIVDDDAFLAANCLRHLTRALGDVGARRDLVHAGAFESACLKLGRGRADDGGPLAVGEALSWGLHRGRTGAGRAHWEGLSRERITLHRVVYFARFREASPHISTAPGCA